MYLIYSIDVTIFEIKKGMKMKKILTSVVVSALVASTLSAADEKKDGFNLKLQDQIRYEGVSQDNALTDAAALTNRFVLGGGYSVSGFGGYVEVTNLAALTNAYNDTSPTKDTTYSVVKDPAQTRLTQAKLTYKNKDFGAVVGRDMYTLDGHRFMGSVIWRQMPQTFDIAALCYKGVEGLKVKAAYVFGRHGVGFYDNLLATEINGVEDPSTKTNSVMLNANYKMNDKISFRLYDYMISSTSDTIGGAVIGTQGDLGYKVETAVQKTASLTTSGEAAPTDIGTALYTNVEVSYKLGSTKLIATNEILGKGTGGSAASFYTPWATLHKFNGWADVYLGGTPTDGLADTKLGAVYKNDKLGVFKAFFHIYNDASFSTAQGTELEILYTRETGLKGLKFLTKAAFFTEGTEGAISATTTDTTKVWAMLTYNFKK